MFLAYACNGSARQKDGQGNLVTLHRMLLAYAHNSTPQTDGQQRVATAYPSGRRAPGTTLDVAAGQKLLCGAARWAPGGVSHLRLLLY